MISARHVEQWPLVTCAHTLAAGVKTHSPWFLGRFQPLYFAGQTTHAPPSTKLLPHHMYCTDAFFPFTPFHLLQDLVGRLFPLSYTQPYHHHERPLSIDADWSFSFPIGFFFMFIPALPT